MTSPPPPSVVVATSQPWPELRMGLESTAPQVRAQGAGVVVAVGHGGGLADDNHGSLPVGGPGDSPPRMR